MSHTGSCASLAEIACDDDGCGDTYQSELILNATGGTTYYIRVSGYNAASGNYILTADLANDECDEALPVTDGTYSFCNVGATTDGPNEPSRCTFSNDSQVGSDIWYCYEAPCSGLATVRLCDSNYDTKVAIYDWCECPTFDSAADCNDDYYCTDVLTLQSQVTFWTVGGELYLIRIGGYQGAQGNGTMTIDHCCTPPDYDYNINNWASSWLSEPMTSFLTGGCRVYKMCKRSGSSA